MGKRYAEVRGNFSATIPVSSGDLSPLGVTRGAFSIVIEIK